MNVVYNNISLYDESVAMVWHSLYLIISINYQGITLSPVISKVFDNVKMKIFEKQLESDPLQFWFKQKSSCQHALL